MTRFRLLVLAAVAGLFAWMFADALFSSGVFVFRDAGHFYYPLFEFARAQWAAGRLPLWNPYENLGVPLAANAAASVFYPGKLIFALPLDYATAYTWYVMAHVLLAAWAAYRLARDFGASTLAGGVAALSYAFSGNVLYQYCNVIFLVGAAWLPLAVLAACRMLSRPGVPPGQENAPPELRQEPLSSRIRWAVAFGVTLAMMTLGGNAEMAYDAGLVAVFYALWLWWSDRRAAVAKQAKTGPLSLWERVRARVAARSGSGSDSAGTEEPSDGDRPHPDPLPKGEGAKSPRPGSLPKGEGAKSPRPGSLPEGEGGRAARPVLLALAAVTGGLLAAIQVLPSAEFTHRSDRAATSVPRTLYELAGYEVEGRTPPDNQDASWSDGLTCRRIELGSHLEHVYHFSVGPWRLAEYVWPNFSGRQFPLNRRWMDAVPAEGRLWVPSLYMGLVPLVLAIAAMRFSSKGGRNAWLTWVVLLAVVASFGWYGLGWLAEEIRAAVGADMTKPWLVGGPFGGLYWLATLVLPGFIYFRYPAKLLVVAALGLSMLAAAGWDRAMAGPAVRLRRGLVGLAAISAAAALAAVAIRPLWDGWFAGMGANVMFGPFDAAGAWRDLFTSFVQTTLVATAFWWLLGRNARGARWTPAAALALVAVELAVANGWMVQCAPAELWKRPRPLAVAIERHDESLATQSPASPNSPTPYRVYRQRLWLPPSWRRTSSPDRLAEGARWDSATLWPKYNLAPRIPLAEVFGTMAPYDYEVFLSARGRLPFVRKRPQAAGGHAEPEPLYYSNVKYFILPANGRVEGGVRVSLDAEGRPPADVSLWQAPGYLPRAWIVHDVEVLASLPSLDPAEMRRRSERAFTSEGRIRDLLRSALVETADGAFPVPRTPETPGETPPADNSERCVVTHYDPLCVRIDARLSRPGLVVLFDQFYPGWQLEIESRGGPSRRVPIVRTNRVMRGAWLPAGEHHLLYRYRPTVFLIGAGVSVLAWIALAGLVLLRIFRTRHPRRDDSSRGA